MRRRNFSGRPAVFVPPSDCPMMAMERGENRSRRRSSCAADCMPALLRRLGWLGPALVETALEQVLGDAVLEDLNRAAGNYPSAAAPHAPFPQIVLAIAGRAHDLDRFVRRFESGLVAGRLGNSGFIGGREPAIGIARRAVEQKLRALELDHHVGEFPLQALKLAQRPPELPAG